MSHVSLTDRRCPDCGEPILNPGAHLERCVGPRAHGECDCPVGYMHLPDCEVTGDETARPGRRRSPKRGVSRRSD